jgi:multiple antibiotic resistance protein
MFDHIKIILLTFAALFPVINPLGGSLIFLNLTQGLANITLNKLAKQIAINTFILLFIVLLSGSWILSFFGITLPIVQIGGGFVVASLAWKVLNQPIKENDDEEKTVKYSDKSVKEMAFFPLTMPLTAGPGAIAATLTVGAHETHKKLIDTIMNQFFAVIGILLVALSVWICYRYAERITSKLGGAGSRVIMRLSAFINLCIGLQIASNGFQNLLPGIVA